MSELVNKRLPPSTSLNGGKYTITKCLDSGGFGVTYKACIEGSQEEVVIKEYFPNGEAERHNNGEVRPIEGNENYYLRWQERFKKEGEILLELHRKNRKAAMNIVRVNEVFSENNTSYLVMELIKGKNLEKEVREGGYQENQMPENKVKKIAEELVNALTEIHSVNLFHLDISLNNILMSEEGEVILIDFGSAKSKSEAGQTNALRPEYAPIELIDSKGDYDARSDLFELGVVLYRLLTGQLPRTAGERRGEEPENWRRGGKGDESLLEPWPSLLDEALQFDKDKRPKTVREWWEGYEAPPEAPEAPQLVSRTPFELTITIPALPKRATHLRVACRKVGENSSIKLQEHFRGGEQAMFKELEPATDYEIYCYVVSQRGKKINGPVLRASTAKKPHIAAPRRVKADKTTISVKLPALPTGALRYEVSTHRPQNHDADFHRYSEHYQGGDVVTFDNLNEGEKIAVKCHAVYASQSKEKEVESRTRRVSTESEKKEASFGVYLLMLLGGVSLWGLAGFFLGELLAHAPDKMLRPFQLGLAEFHLPTFGAQLGCLTFALTPWEKIRSSKQGRRGLDYIARGLAIGAFGGLLRAGGVGVNFLLPNWTLVIPFTGYVFKVGQAALPHSATAFHWLWSPLVAATYGALLSAALCVGYVLWKRVIDTTRRNANRGVMSLTRPKISSYLYLSVAGAALMAVGWKAIVMLPVVPATVTQLVSLSDNVSSVAISPDGKLLASTNNSTNIQLWDAQTGELVSLFRGSWPVDARFSSDGRFLLSPEADNAVKAREVTSGSIVKTFVEEPSLIRSPSGALETRLPTAFTSCAISDDGKTVFGGSEGVVTAWDFSTKRVLWSRTEQKDNVWALAISPDGKRLASGNGTGKLAIWDVKTGQQIASMSSDHQIVRSVVFVPGGDLVSSGKDGSIKIWDGQGKPIRTLSQGSSVVSSLAVSPDGTTLVAGALDGIVRVWRIKDWQERPTLTVERAVRSLCFLSDSRTLAVGRVGQIEFRDVETKNVLVTFRSLNKQVWSLDFSADGKQLACQYGARQLMVWNTSDWACRQLIKDEAEQLYGVGLSPSGNLIGSALEESYAQLKEKEFIRRAQLWVVASGDERATHGSKERRLWKTRDLAFSPDGRNVAYAMGNQIVSFNYQGTADATEYKGHTDVITSIAYSPDAKWLASAAEDHTVRLWQAGKQVAVLPSKDAKYLGQQSHDLAFSPDSSLLACSDGGRVYIWNIINRTDPQTIGEVQDSQIRDVAFPSSGNYIVAVGGKFGSESFIKIWDISGKPTVVQTLGEDGQGLQGIPSSVTFTKIGSSIKMAVGSWDQISIWDFDPQAANPAKFERTISLSDIKFEGKISALPTESQEVNKATPLPTPTARPLSAQELADQGLKQLYIEKNAVAAKESYLKAVRLNRNEITWLYHLAIAESRSGNMEQAVKRMKKLVDLGLTGTEGMKARDFLMQHPVSVRAWFVTSKTLTKDENDRLVGKYSGNNIASSSASQLNVIVDVINNTKGIEHQEVNWSIHLESGPDTFDKLFVT